METKLSIRLKALRKSEALSVSDVLTGLKQYDLTFCEQSVYKWEEGSATPSINILNVLAKIYHCNLSYLISDDDIKYKRVSNNELNILRQFRTDFLFRSAVSQLMRIIDRNTH